MRLVKRLGPPPLAASLPADAPAWRSPSGSDEGPAASSSAPEPGAPSANAPALLVELEAIRLRWEAGLRARQRGWASAEQAAAAEAAFLQMARRAGELRAQLAAIAPDLLEGEPFLSQLGPSPSGAPEPELPPTVALRQHLYGLVDAAGLVGCFGAAAAGELLMLLRQWEQARGRRSPEAAALLEAFRDRLARAEAAPRPAARAIASQAGAAAVTSPAGAPAKALKTSPTWPADMAKLIAVLEQLQPEALPVEFRIPPGIIVTHPARFLAALRLDVAGGPGGLRARSGVLKMDLEGLAGVVAQQEEEPR